MTVEYYLYIILLFASVAFGFTRFQRLSVSLKLLVLLLSYTLLHETIVHLLGGKYATAIYWTYANVKIPVYMLILGLFAKTRSTRRFLIIIAGLSAMSTLVCTILLAGTQPFPSTAEIITSPITLLSCGLIYREIMQNVSEQRLITQPVFIVSSLIIIYTCGTFTQIALTSSLFFKSYHSPSLANDIHTSLSIIFYLGLFYAIYLDQKQQTSHGQPRI